MNKIIDILLSHHNANEFYVRRYVNFIEKFSGTGGSIKHHILPKASDCWPEFECFKTNEWNKSELTLRQHFVAHWILWKALGGSQTQAFWMMKHVEKQDVNSRVYENLSLQIDHKRLQQLRKESNLRNYGVANVMQLPDVAKKANETLFERHGVRSIRHLPGAAERFKETWASEDYKNSETYKNFIANRTGGGNGRAKNIAFRNKTYDCIKDAIAETGVSRYLILKEINK